MTKYKALALLDELEKLGMAATLSLGFPDAGPASWTVQLDPKSVYRGEQLYALGDYCEQQSLNLSAQFSALGIT